MKKIVLTTLILTMSLFLFGCSDKDIQKIKNETKTIDTKTVETETIEIKTPESNTPETNTIETAKNNEKAEEPTIEGEVIVEGNEEENVVEKPSNGKKTVVIDPGHGPGGNSEKEAQSPDSSIMKIKDGGGADGINSKTPEYVITMNVSLKLKSLLEANGINVIMTKEDINLVPGNIERAEVGNNNNADLAIRIHCDSADVTSAKGASMLVPAPVGYATDIAGISRTYGEIILNSLVANVGMYNRGVIERSDLTGFNWSKVPVVLIEMGFLSNPEEDSLLNDASYQEKIAQGLCNGILEALDY